MDNINIYRRVYDRRGGGGGREEGRMIMIHHTRVVHKIGQVFDSVVGEGEWADLALTYR